MPDRSSEHQKEKILSSGKFSKIQVKTQKSINNSMSSFGLIEKIWSCLIFIKLYQQIVSIEDCANHFFKMNTLKFVKPTF